MKIFIMIVLIISAVWALSEATAGFEGKEKFKRLAWVSFYSLIVSVFGNILNQ